MRVTAIASLSLLSILSVAAADTTRDGIGRFALDANSLRQWKLPKRLREISGLALTPDGRLFAVDDEQAIIYQIDYQQGKTIKAFALGGSIARADFEGIAYFNDRFYLVTSNGLIYVAPEGEDGSQVDFDVYQTGLGRYCEIEGLATDARSAVLFMACKKRKGKNPNSRFSIFAWSPETRRVVHDREIAIPEDEIGRRIGKKHIRPTALTIDPETAHLFGISGPQRAIFEMAPNGELVDAIILPLADRHRQAEGLEITRDGRLLIVDEGGKKKARLSVYSPDNNKISDQHE